MMMLVSTCLVAALAGGASFDTTVAVRAGARLEVSNFGGGIRVRTWRRNTVHVTASCSPRARVLVDSDPATLAVRSVGHMGVPGEVDYDIEIPQWMDVKLSGVSTRMELEGLQSGIEANTVKGGIALTGGRGFVHLAAVQGGVDVTGARGRLEVSSVNDDVHVTDVAGEVAAQTVNGDIVIERADAAVVEGQSVNGDVAYSGAIRPGGRYRLGTHNGDVTVVLPREAGAAISVATFNGDFESSFPVRIEDARAGRRFRFVLGDGRATLDLESFQGTVRLLRTGETKDLKDLKKDLRELKKDMKVVKLKRKEDE